MSDKILVRIEYNELDGDIHYEHDLESEQGDNGYNTIADRVDSDLAFEFGEVIDERYPNLGDEEESEYPSFEQVKADYQKFIVAKGSNLA
ncbi:hypothetical protein [Spirosoma aerophilum]